MRTWSFYDSETGLFRARSFTGPSRALAVNTPDGFVAIEGKHDHLCRRMDLQTGAIVPYQPPQPDANHEWNGTTERWEKRADVLAREARRAASLAQIAELESKQHRRVRELLEASDPRLQEISAEIEQLRSNLT